MLQKLIDRFKRKPDYIIGSEDDPYIHRWWVIPRNRFLNVYLHHIMRSDDDRALHDHPWHNISIILKGEYMEMLPNGSRILGPGMIVFRKATCAHRLVLRDWDCPIDGAPRGPVWSLFITGPKIRSWGFHCPKGWVHWRDFLGQHEGYPRVSEHTGPGCE